MLRTFAICSVFLVSVFCSGFAQATVITQTVTNSADLSIDNLSIAAQDLVPQSFFNGNFLPFVGADLTSASILVTFTFDGNVVPGTNGGSAYVSFAGDLYLNGVIFGGTGNGSGTGGASSTADPLTVDASQSFPLLYGNPALTAIVGGPSPFLLTFGTAGNSPASAGGVPGTQLEGVLTSTEVLTYTFTGDGSLLPVVTVPEPTSSLLLGSGLVLLIGFRRRMSASVPNGSTAPGF